MKRFDAVLFDAGETLLHPHPSFPDLLVHLIRERGHDVGTGAMMHAEAALSDAVGEWASQRRTWSTSPEASRAFWTRLYRRLTEELGIDDPRMPDHLYDEFRKPEHYRLFDDALPALRELQRRGHRLGVVSNFEAWLERLLASLEVMPMLEALVVSGVEGIEKPDPRIFEIAIDRMGVPAERTCYVGDNPWADVEPARGLGMHALLIDRRGRYDPEEWPVVGALTEVPEAIA